MQQNFSVLKEKLGLKIVSTYFIIYIFLPMIFQFIYHEEILSIYNQQKFNLNTFLSSIFVFSLFVIFYIITPTLNLKFILMPWSKYCFMIMGKYLSNRKIFCKVLLFIAIYFFLNANTDLRYSGESLKQQGGQSFFILIVKMLIYFDFAFIFFLKNFSPFQIFFKYGNFSILTSHMLLLGGSGDAIIGIILAVFIYFPRTFNYFTSIEMSKANFILLRNSIKFTLAILAAIPSLIIILLVATIMKSNQNSLVGIDLNLFIQTYFNLKNMILYLGEAFSSHLHSLNYAITNYSNYSDSNFVKLSKIPIDGLMYRLNMILGNIDTYGIQKSIYTSFSRFNFLEVSGNYLDERQGTSPGVIASFVYLFGTKVGILFSIIYLIFISKVIDNLNILSNYNFNMIGSFCAFQILIILFQSPYDNLNIMDNMTLTFIFLITFSSALKYYSLKLK